jgi:copper chaperone CopZ
MKKLILIVFLVYGSLCLAQIKNTKTEVAKIYGSCFMCKTKIEAAGNRKGIAEVEWNLQTLMARITFDAKKTNSSAILKRIAMAGFDNDKFTAPDAAYEKLDKCCHYERIAKHQYECAMCETTSLLPGKCPVCNMAMTKKINKK